MKVIIDKYKLFASSRNILTVVDDMTYIHARESLFDFLIWGKAKYDLILITENPYIEWFHDLDEEHIQIISPISVLKEKYKNFDLPLALTDVDVLELDLLTVGFEPSPELIFKHFTNGTIPKEISISGSLFELSQIVLTSGNILKKGYLKDLWQSELKKLSVDLDENGKNLLSPIIGLDEEFCKTLSAGIYLAKHPTYLEFWKDGNAIDFFKRGIDINIITEKIAESDYLVGQIMDSFETTLRKFLENQYKIGVDANELTGRYTSELDAFLGVRQELDQQMHDLVLKKFERIITEAQRHKLSQLIIPELKPMPYVEGKTVREQAELLKNWSVESFIPYKFYYDNVKNVPENIIEQIENNANLFGDWLFKNLKSIFADDDIYTNIDVVKKISPLLNSGNTVIWLIIDGLPSSYLKTLERILKENGVNSLNINFSFATLPTITEVAMPIMVSGKFQQNIPEKDLLIRQNLLDSAFPGKKCIYSSQPVDLIKDLRSHYNLCCLHVRDIDSTLHKGDNEFLNGRFLEIESILHNHIKIITSIIKDASNKKISLVISTDHGATKCLVGANMVKNTKLNDLAVSRPRERSVPLSGKLKDESVDENEVYRLTMEMSKNNIDWAIARGYKYFGKNDSGYRHGGLTPEEVVVPVIIGEIKTHSAARIKITVSGRKEMRFGKTEKEFVLRIRNPEDSAINITKISIIEDQASSFKVPFTINSETEINAIGVVKLHQRLQEKAKNGKLQLRVNILYDYLGEKFDDVVEITVLTQQDEFDDFDF